MEMSVFPVIRLASRASIACSTNWTLLSAPYSAFPRILATSMSNPVGFPPLSWNPNGGIVRVTPTRSLPRFRVWASRPVALLAPDAAAPAVPAVVPLVLGVQAARVARPMPPVLQATVFMKSRRLDSLMFPFSYWRADDGSVAPSFTPRHFPCQATGQTNQWNSRLEAAVPGLDGGFGPTSSRFPGALANPLKQADAIDLQHRPGHPAGLLGEQEEYAVGNVARFAHAVEQGAGSGDFARCLVGELKGRRVGWPWRDGVNPHIVGAELAGQRFGQPDHAAFGGRIGGARPGGALLAVCRGKGYDRGPRAWGARPQVGGG